MVTACLHGSSNPFRAGGSGSTRPEAAAGDVQDRMAALVPPAQPAAAGTQVSAPGSDRPLLRRLRLLLRFWVAEVDENIDGVIETIADALSTFQLQGPPPTSPRA